MATDVVLSSLRLMVIDDDLFIHELLAMNLEEIGIIQSTFCQGGKEALKKIDGGGIFDVILVDLKMPEMDGIEVIRNLAARNYPGSILLLSAEDNKILMAVKSLADAHRLNVLGALSKPVPTDILKKNLMHSLEQSKNLAIKPLSLVSADDLKEAIVNEQIVPYFQPKIEIGSKKLHSAEVLARWNHPTKGVISPISFISVAEESGLIDALTHSIFRQALAQLDRWRTSTHPDILLSINLSTDSLSSIDLPEQIEDLASINNVPCSSIALEITETRLIENMAASLDVLTRIRLKGFALSIDDFGTGYSSLSQLKNIPFTELKIDRAFVNGASKNHAAKAILESSIELGKKLNMLIVAEGVETLEDWELLAKLNCDLAQGYFIAKPLPAEGFTDWISSWQNAAF